MKDNRIFYSPVVAFYLTPERTLMPLFIQLTRSTHYENEIFVAPNYVAGKALHYQVIIIIIILLFLFVFIYFFFIYFYLAGL